MLGERWLASALIYKHQLASLFMKRREGTNSDGSCGEASFKVYICEVWLAHCIATEALISTYSIVLLELQSFQ